MKVFPIGYSSLGAQERIDALLGYPRTLLIDTRLKPYCKWSEDWRKEALELKYGERYRWAGKYLGNSALGTGRIVIADPLIGIPGLMKYLREDNDLVLLCQCREFSKCHMSTICTMLLDKMPDIEVIRYEPVQQPDTIPCISIKQPWAWLIANGFKSIENRDRDFTGGYRGPILLHAGKAVDGDCFVDNEINLNFFEQFGSDVVDALPRYKRDYALGCIVGQADLIDVVTESDDHWFCGDYGIVLANAMPIDPIPYRGQLGLFGVPRSVLDQSEVSSDPTPSLGPCADCGEPATLRSPSGRPQGLACEKHGYCGRCKGSIDKFVLHHDCYVCPCVAAYAEQIRLQQEMKQAKQVQLF